LPQSCIDGVSDTITRGDFEGATRHVRHFRDVERLLSVNTEDYQTMVAAEQQLKESVASHFEQAVSKADHAGVQRFFALFSALGDAAQGLDKLIGYLKQVVTGEKKRAQVMEGSAFTGVMQALLNSTARLLQENLPLVGEAGRLTLVQALHAHCDAEGGQVLQGYARERGLARRPELQAAALDEEQMLGLDSLLDEMATLCQHVETFHRFMRFQVRGTLAALQHTHCPSTPSR
jgi:hypothetical protein